MIRGSRVCLIFTNTVDVASSNAGDSAAVTLMSTDVERIANSLQEIHEIWAGPVEIGLGIWLLERQLGLACLVPVAVGIGMSYSTFNSTV